MDGRKANEEIDRKEKPRIKLLIFKGRGEPISQARAHHSQRTY